MASHPEKISFFFRPAGIIIFLLIIFIIGTAVAAAFDYNGRQQAAAAADQVQRGINRLKDLATERQLVNDRVPRAYIFRLRDCRQDCFYELGVLTAEGQTIALEKVFLGSVAIQSLSPQAGVLELILAAGESSPAAIGPYLAEIGTAFSRRRFLAAFTFGGQWQRADFTSFGQTLPEAYLPQLTAGGTADIEIVSTTEAGSPRSLGLYWQKNGSFSQLSVKLIQVGGSEEKVLRSEIRNFDSSLATLCFDLPDGQPQSYRVVLEPQGTAGETAENISLRVFKEADCRGDNLPQAIGQVEISKPSR